MVAIHSQETEKDHQSERTLPPAPGQEVKDQVGTAPAFTSETDALQMLESALSYLSADPVRRRTAARRRGSASAALPTGFFGW